jgi:hypothetical protein
VNLESCNEQLGKECVAPTRYVVLHRHPIIFHNALHNTVGGAPLQPTYLSNFTVRWLDRFDLLSFIHGWSVKPPPPFLPPCPYDSLERLSMRSFIDQCSTPAIECECGPAGKDCGEKCLGGINDAPLLSVVCST